MYPAPRAGIDRKGPERVRKYTKSTPKVHRKFTGFAIL